MRQQRCFSFAVVSRQTKKTPISVLSVLSVPPWWNQIVDRSSLLLATDAGGLIEMKTSTRCRLHINRYQRPVLNMLRLTKYIILILLFLLLSGCAQLPEYAKPRMVEFENRPASHNHGFTYRALSVDDFQAQSLPDNLVSHTQNIAAHACCRIRTTKDASYKITRGYLNQQIQYFGTITHIAFEAVMVPACSWLNPKVTEEKLDYVLQHEQIHFI
jgi:hypothetical protein